MSSPNNPIKHFDYAMPVVCTYNELTRALAPLHQWEKQWLDPLHDLWRNGPPSPESQLLNPHLFDERKSDEFNFANGNVVRRLVRAEYLRDWLKDCCAARGIQMDRSQAGQIIQGQYKIAGSYDG